MKKITTFAKYDRRFTIVEFENWYCAIEDVDIDENGRLKKDMNGLQMNAQQTLDGCIRLLEKTLDMDEYEKQGMTEAEAFAKVNDIPLEAAKELFKF